MNRMIAITISPGATTAALRETGSPPSELTTLAPTPTSTSGKVPGPSEKGGRHSCEVSWKLRTHGGSRWTGVPAAGGCVCALGSSAPVVVIARGCACVGVHYDHLRSDHASARSWWDTVHRTRHRGRVVGGRAPGHNRPPRRARTAGPARGDAPAHPARRLAGTRSALRCRTAGRGHRLPGDVR